MNPVMVFKNLRGTVSNPINILVLAFVLTGCSSGTNENVHRVSEQPEKTKLESSKALLMTRIDDYLTVPAKTTTGLGYLKGKVVVVETTGRKIDKLHDELPEKLRANDPAEVGTVIVLKRTLKYAGGYAAGNGEKKGFATRELCELKVVDLEAAAVVGSTEFISAPPPLTVKADTIKVMGVETKVILDFLNSLPRKDRKIPR